MRQIKTIQCTQVVAQVNLGFYDAEGNLVGEELFPQSSGHALAAKLFHPHQDQLGSLIEMCIQQAWEKVKDTGPTGPLAAVSPLPETAETDPGADEAGGAGS